MTFKNIHLDAFQPRALGFCKKNRRLRVAGVPKAKPPLLNLATVISLPRHQQSLVFIGLPEIVFYRLFLSPVEQRY